MTIIAWDGKTLAADRQATSGYIKVGTTKIVKCPTTGRLIGSAGGMGSAQLMMQWILDGEDMSKYPPCQNDKDDWARIIIVNPDGTLNEYERLPKKLVLQPIEGYHAIGIGREVALGALAMGADARTAVAIASTYVDGCGLGIDTLTLD